MICKPCNVAGDLVAISRQNENFKDETLYVPLANKNESWNVNTKSTLAAVASLYHGLCRGKSHCDCQHKIDFEGRTIQNGETR